METKMGRQVTEETKTMLANMGVH